MKAAAIYCRVSTEDQEREGTSLQSQLEACVAKVKELGYEVGEQYIFKEAFSGLTLDRPILNQLREQIKENCIEAIIIYTPDRLCRNGEDILSLAKEFKTKGVKLVFVKEQWEETLNGKLIAFILGWASEFEASQIKERSIRGKVARAKEGKLPGGKASQLYGYNYQSGVRHINLHTAQVVKDCFRWFVEERLTIGRIVARLSSLNIPSPSGKTYWSKAQVCKMLKNQAYAGQTFFRFKLISEQAELPNTTPAIISQEVFNEAQTRLKRNKELATRNTKREYLLRGHIICGQCGRHYSGSYRASKRNHKVRTQQVYRCTRQYEPSPPLRCHNHIWNTKRLEEIVWEQIENILSHPETVLNGIKVIENRATELDLLQQELLQTNERLHELSREQDQLLHWALKGFPEETIIRSNERMNQTSAELKQHRAELQNRIESARQDNFNIHDIKQACELVRCNLNELSFVNKCFVLEVLNIQVWIEGEKIRIEGSIPLGDGSIVTTRSPPHLSLARQLFL